ncbi:hypothetical protein BGX28_004565 [Mortierella sp. GBA30]|nr:hypothetical protein BGX28_004565 [Mortierella sp. GBA30]
MCLQEISLEFVSGFVQAFDGEKDPRNLMLAFSSIKGIIREFDIAPHIEDLFEVTFCYFPITYSPPPDDINGISSEQLKAGLQQSLAATPYFAKFALPLLLEKLAVSSSNSTKKDVMETITGCCSAYGSTSLLPYAEELWSGLKKEIFHASSHDLEQVALITLQAVTTELSLGVSLGGAQDAVEQFLGPVSMDCMEQLQAEDATLVQQSCKSLKACAMSSDPACATVVLPTIPVLLSQYTSETPTMRKETIMDALLALLEANRALYGTKGLITSSRDANFVTPLLDFKEQLFELFTSAVTTQEDFQSLRLRAVKGIYGMTVLRQLLPDAESVCAVKQLARVLLQDPSPEVQRNLDFYLYAISKTGLHPTMFVNIVPQMLMRIDMCCHGHHSLDTPYYPLALLNTLLEMLQHKATFGHQDIPQYLDQLIPHLLGMCIYPTLTFHGTAHVMKDPAILETIADLARLVVTHADVYAQNVFVRAIFNIFALGNLSVLATFRADMEQVPFAPLHSDSRTSQQNTSILFAAVIDGCRQQTSIPVDNLQEFTESLANVALKSNNRTQRSALIRTVATILNKYNRGNILQDLISNSIVPKLHSILFAAGPQDGMDIDGSIEKTEQEAGALEMYIWVTKSLVLSVNTIGHEMAGDLMKLFAVPKFGRAAADGYAIILGDQKGTLTKDLFAVIRAEHNTIDESQEVPETGNAKEVRAAALECVATLAQSLPLSVLEPFKSQVLQESERLLDDPKRAVRVAAVGCRDLWFELGCASMVAIDVNHLKILSTSPSFGPKKLSNRRALPPQKALKLARSYLDHAQTIDDPDLILAWCMDAFNALSRIKSATRKALIPPKTGEDQDLCNGIYNAYVEQAKLLEGLKQDDMAQTSVKKSEKWRHANIDTQSTSDSKAMPKQSDIAKIPSEVFSQNVTRPEAKNELPKLGARITGTPQLAYSLVLLSKATSSTLPSAADLDEPLDETQLAWREAIVKDTDEQERLQSLASKLIAAFVRDNLNNPATVAEVVHLAPALDKDCYRRLLSDIIFNINQSKLLELTLLEGLAQMIQHAAPGCLPADDLVQILDTLSVRLRGTHEQTTSHLHQLLLAVSRVLDAMADCEVKGLSRKFLHEPLAAYLDSLKSSTDPYLVYQAAYAYQALQYVPDDESPLQAVFRRTRGVVKIVSGLVSAAKGLDLNGFLEELAKFPDGFEEIYKGAKIGYESITSRLESGQSLKNSLKEGISFCKKRTWYPALRGADTLLREGRLAEFKRLMCEAPCRRDPAFQWGLCLRLGDIASDGIWEASIRLSAIKFLVELYKNDADWGQHANIKQWILNILVQLISISEGTVKEHAQVSLQELSGDGEVKKKLLYQTCINGPACQYKFKVGITTLASPSLLDHVQDIPDVEDDLRKLKERRLETRYKSVYIPPQAKANLQAPDSTMFPLMDSVKEFLKSDRQVLLLLGDSGAGKSIFNRMLECNLWESYKKKSGSIPLHINLPAINRPEKDLIAKQLRKNDFTETQIREMKRHRHFVLICDGYDECKQSNNLYTSNQLNEPDSHWRAKMVISCRSEYLPQDYRDRFQPTSRNHSGMSDLFQQAVIVAFSETQIKDYIERYVSLNRPEWHAKDYLQAMENIPNLLDLVKNPFLLTLCLEVLPRALDPTQLSDSSPGAKMTRVALYDQFVQHWLERGKKRLGAGDLSSQTKAAFDALVNEGFTQNGIHFLKRLAVSIYKEQAGQPIVEYSEFKDEGTWKAEFFSSRADEIRLLREACPLKRSNNQYRFIHKSVLEYFFTLAVYDPQENNDARPPVTPVRRGSVDSTFSFEGQDILENESLSVQQPIVKHPLSLRSFVSDPSILQFLVERVQQEPLFKKQLLAMIEISKTDKDGRIAAANAITILVRAGARFNGADLRGIQIPGADLSGGEFDSSNLQGVDLRRPIFATSGCVKPT